MHRSASTIAALLVSALTVGLIGAPSAFANTSSQATFTQARRSVQVLPIVSAPQPAPQLRQARGSCLGPVNPILSVTVCSGDGQSAAVGTADAHPLQASVTTVGLLGVPHVPVVFTAPSAGPSGTFQKTGTTTEVDTTDAHGLATSSLFVANHVPGPVPVTARLGLRLPSLPWLSNVATFHLINVGGPAVAITATAGGGQSIQVGATFATPLALRVTDRFGNAVSGKAVTFTGPASGAGGSLSPTSATTNASGVASTSATADHVAGTWTATASVAGVAGNATFQLTNAAGALDHLTLAPAAATVTADNPATTYTAQGFDVFGNSLGDVTASTTFSITNGTCNVASCSSTTAGTQTVTGADSSRMATATITVTPGAASQITVSPATAVIEQGSSRTFAVTAFDAFGDSLGDVTTSTIFSSSSSGIATCSGATCTGVGAGSVTVTATYGGVTRSVALTITPRTPAAVAIDSGNNQSAAAGATFAPLGVRVTDAAGNPLTGTAVTFAVTAGTAGGVVSPTTTTTDAMGLASTTATANTVSGQWTVTAAAGGFTATFTLTNTPGPVATVSLSLDQATIAGDGSTVAIATATVEDANGNPRIGEQVSFTASPSTGVEKSPVVDNLDGSYSINLGGINGGPSSIVVTLTAVDNGISDSAALTVTPVAIAQPPGRTPVPTPVPTPRRIPGGGGPSRI